MLFFLKNLCTKAEGLQGDKDSAWYKFKTRFILHDFELSCSDD